MDLSTKVFGIYRGSKIASTRALRVEEFKEFSHTDHSHHFSSYSATSSWYFAPTKERFHSASSAVHAIRVARACVTPRQLQLNPTILSTSSHESHHGDCGTAVVEILVTAFTAASYLSFVGSGRSGLHATGCEREFGRSGHDDH